MEIKIPLRKSVGFRLVIFLMIWIVPALACSRDTVATGEPSFFFPSETATGLSSAVTGTPLGSVVTKVSPTRRPTMTPRPTKTFPPTHTPRPNATLLPIAYTVQAGDTLRTVALRFDVLPSDIHLVNGDPVPEEGLLSPGTVLTIPYSLTDTTGSAHLFPDSAIVYSATFIGFDPVQYVNGQNGYLASYVESGETVPRGAETLRQVAFNNSFSPKLLLALLEYESGWVTQKDPPAEKRNYPMGDVNPADQGLAAQFIWATNVLSIGYYGWRDASTLEVPFADGSSLRLAPDLNAGTVAVMYYLASVTSGRAEWEQALQDFRSKYIELFGDPFEKEIDPLYYPDLVQPPMELPFKVGQVWSFTGGPHGAWERDGAQAAVDFAPTDAPNCVVSPSWVTASAPGVIVRSTGNVVVIDLDGDGYEETGWNILYLHIADQDHISVNSRIETDTPLGHPSCLGGRSNGTHVHMARKFNGEWMLAGGPVPFNLSGWVAQAGDKPYDGTLTRGDDVAIANPLGSAETTVWR